MRKLMSALVIIVILSGVIAFALLNLSSLINRNKTYLLAQAEQTLGRQVTVEEIGVTVWGGIGMRLSNFAVADDPAFSQEEFLRAADLQVNVEFLPLLWRELRVRRFILHQPVITIIRDKQGQLNFASLGGSPSKEQASSQEQSGTAETPSPATTAFPLFAAFLNISNGTVRYIDRQEQTDFRVSQLDLTVEDLSFDQPFTLALNTALLAERQNLKLHSRVGPLGSTLDLTNLPVEGTLEIDSLDVSALQQALPHLTQQLPQGLGLSGPLRATMSIAGTVGQLTLPKVDLTTAVFAASKPNVKLSGRLGPLGTDLKDLSLKGDLELGPVALAQLTRFAPLAAVLPPDLSADGPLSLKAQVEGTVENLALTGTLDVSGGTISMGDSFKKPQGTSLVLSTDARVTPHMVALQKATLQLHTLALAGSGKINLGKTLSLDLTVDANPTTLVGWEELLPLLQNYNLSGTLEAHARLQGSVTKDTIPQINGSLSLRQVQARLPQMPAPLTDLNATVAFTGQGATFTDTSLRMGNSLVRVDGRVERFAPLALTYRLSAPELHLADLQADASASNGATVLREVSSEGRVRMDNGGLVYKGSLSSPQGVLSQVAYRNFHTAVSMEAQTVTIDNVGLQAFGGSVQGRGRYTFQQIPPQFALTSQVRDLNLTELFHSTLTTAPQHIQGQANLDLTLSGSGQGWEELKPSLQGQGQAEVRQGALLNVNIAEGVLSGVTGLPGLSLLVSPRIRERYPEIFATQNTEFNELRSTFTFSNGKMNIDDLRIAAADYTIQGTGWVDFDQTLDLRSQLILSQKLSTDIANDVQAARFIVNEQKRLEIPFALAGTLPRVRPQPDLAYVGVLLQRAAVRKGTEELEKRVLKKLLPSSQEPPPAEGEEAATAPTAPQKPAKKEDLKEQLLRKGLEQLFGR
jgi:uncharacterized protein involved in outer membrane biogenesis